MGALLSYLRDVRFYLPALFLVAFEGALQLGLYKPLLQPHTYAENLYRVVSTNQETSIEPQILLLGTSVAYQGLNMPLLNELLEPHGLAAVNAATEGARLLTHHLIYRALAPHLSDLQYVVHVTEPTFAWVERNELDPANMSMVAQFSRLDSLPLLQRYGYQLTGDDYSYLLVRTLTYQSDLRNLTLNPAKRVRTISRRNRDAIPDYPYLNRYSFGMSAYPATTLDECIEAARAGVPEHNEAGEQITDRHHRSAVLQTCEISRRDPMTMIGESQWRQIFFDRLAIFYRELQRDGVEVINLFPPFVQLIERGERDEVRMGYWLSELESISDGQEHPTIDLRFVLDGPDNLDYYYDTIHLNRHGAERFTRAVAEALIKEIIGAAINDDSTSSGGEEE